MKLYTFEPYGWSFCGGAIVVIAQDLPHAIFLAKARALELDDDDKDDLTFSDDKIILDNEDQRWGKWLLTNTVSISSDVKAGVIVYNYNNTY